LYTNFTDFGAIMRARRSFRQRHRRAEFRGRAVARVSLAVTDAGIAPGASTASGQIAKGAKKK
jgi:hypothetical protein